MPMHDIALTGPGLAPGAIALVLHAIDPALRILLLSPGDVVCGSELELVLPDRLAPASAACLEGVAVGDWPQCTISRRGEVRTFAERVWLLDPLLLWLELQGRTAGPETGGIEAGGIEVAAGCGPVRVEGSTVHWPGGQADAAHVIDFSAHAGPERHTEIVSSALLAGLSCPVIADFDAGGTAWDYVQYVPIGADRALISRCRRAAPVDLAVPNPLEPDAVADALIAGDSSALASLAWLTELLGAFGPAA